MCKNGVIITRTAGPVGLKALGPVPTGTHGGQVSGLRIRSHSFQRDWAKVPTRAAPETEP